MVRRRCDIHNAARDDVAVRGVLDRQGATAPEDVRHEADVIRIEMLHNRYRERKRARQVLENGGERRQATRRCGDRDQMKHSRDVVAATAVLHDITSDVTLPHSATYDVIAGRVTLAVRQRGIRGASPP